MFRNKNINNTIWNLMDIFLYPVFSFVSTPFFIHHLGKIQFGIWMLMSTIIISMQVFNFGIGSTVLKNISFFSGKHDEANKIKTVNNAISITIILFLVSIVFGLICYFLILNKNLFHVEQKDKLLCAKCSIVACLLVGIKFFEQIFTSYFKALENYKTAAFLGSGNRLCGLCLNVIFLLIFPYNILITLLVLAFVNVVFIIIGFLWLRKNLDGYHFNFSLKWSKSEYSFALFTWLQSLAIILTFQADKYFVVTYFGLIILSYYAFVSTIFNHLHMGLNALLPWLSPKFTKLYAQNKKSNELYLSARNIVTGSSLLLLTILYLLYPFVFRILLGNEMAIATKEYMKYFILFEAFFVLGIVPNYYFNAVGHERSYSYFIFCFSALTLLCMFMSVHIFHTVISILYGLIVACAVGMFALRILFSKITEHSYNITSCIIQMLPSLIFAGFILCDNILFKAFFLLLMISVLYLTHVRGHKEKFILLINS